jgi:tetratricopeptide (TPR) repeat protein
MARHAKELNEAFGSDFTLAVSTIGLISYLTDATVIDMLGLTDPYIAKHPEQIPGLTSTWKERRFNSKYLLSRDPDIILFSTGIRPSAPAEKALFLHSKFRRNYYLYGFRIRRGQHWKYMHVYKRKGEFDGVDTVHPDPAFVEIYSRAVYLASEKHHYQDCLEKLEELIKVMPEDFARGYEFLGTCHFWLGNTEAARAYTRKAVEMDDYSVEAHSVLHDIYVREGNTEAADRETSTILRYNPEMIRAEG